MTRAPLSQPDAVLGQLRHKLRTPLTHIVGYSELLLEDDQSCDCSFRALLTAIHQNAQSILTLVQQRLSPADGQDSESRIELLRDEMAQPVMLIIRSAAQLAGELYGHALLDAVRINTAAAELLAFAQRAETDVLRPASAPRIPSFRAESGGSAAPAHVLVVDDNEVNCDVLVRQLTRERHQVVWVENGLKALRELESTNFDLVLLDVMMPGMNGFEVLAEIKANPGLSGIPVIMMSALDEIESAARCIQMGAEDYLIKPCDPVLLEARLHSVLERRRLHQMEQQRTRELEQASRELRRANEDLARFAFAASHDLQEPLRTMTTVLELFAKQYAPDPESQMPELLSLAIGASRQMSQLVQDLLAYSTAGGQDRVAVPVDSENALESAVAALGRSIEESGAVVTHDPLPRVLYDPAQLPQVFQNLIGNAIKYRSPGVPAIHISAGRDKSDYVFTVRDNGVGIEPQYISRIFEPFRRLHGREIPGTGLGLAICQRSLEGFGGRIWVESTPGDGSTFFFALRAADA